ncbi:MAG TPA: alkanal monooxygenase, partial [Chloroflexota bacterium]|nr:alkanal monooxygenase [Chloroflexota bacterium]
RSGHPGTLPSPEEAAAYPYTEWERDMVRARQADQVIGSPETVRQGLTDLLDRTQANELMLTTILFDPTDRLRSYELVAALRAGRPASVLS